jgi:hypothetical protein
MKPEPRGGRPWRQNAARHRRCRLHRPGSNDTAPGCRPPGHHARSPVHMTSGCRPAPGPSRYARGSRPVCESKEWPEGARPSTAAPGRGPLHDLHGHPRLAAGLGVPALPYLQVLPFGHDAACARLPAIVQPVPAIKAGPVAAHLHQPGPDLLRRRRKGGGLRELRPVGIGDGRRRGRRE